MLRFVGDDDDDEADDEEDEEEGEELVSIRGTVAIPFRLAPNEPSRFSWVTPTANDEA